MIRIGQGYDVHRLKEGRRLVLGGIEIPFEKGLEGHSDADVLLHAIMDAMLGACALGDIGKMFPDNDPELEGADSAGLLALVNSRINALGYHVSNIDSTIIAQAPKLSGHIDAMCSRISQVLCIPLDCVSVKATTEERLGFTGSGSGIAAQAVVLIAD